MSETTMPVNPERQLAEEILGSLIEKSLVRTEERERILGKIMKGKMDKTDWDTAIRLKPEGDSHE